MLVFDQNIDVDSADDEIRSQMEKVSEHLIFIATKGARKIASDAFLEAVFMYLPSDSHPGSVVVSFAPSFNWFLETGDKPGILDKMPPVYFDLVKEVKEYISDGSASPDSDGCFSPDRVEHTKAMRDAFLECARLFSAALNE